MPRPSRLQQHKPPRDSKEVKLAEFNEIRKENNRLKREVARLKKELNKRAEYVEPVDPPEPMAKEPIVPVGRSCPGCGSPLKEVKVFNKTLMVCGECQYKKAIDNDSK
jgi:formamidopyrimidine-DNA glycosylase